MVPLDDVEWAWQKSHKIRDEDKSTILLRKNLEVSTIVLSIFDSHPPKRLFSFPIAETERLCFLNRIIDVQPFVEKGIAVTRALNAAILEREENRKEGRDDEKREVEKIDG